MPDANGQRRIQTKVRLALIGGLALLCLVACLPRGAERPSSSARPDPPPPTVREVASQASAPPTAEAGAPATAEQGAPPTAPSLVAPSPTYPQPTLTSTAPPDPDLRITRGPYLQCVTDESVVVVWETDRAGEGAVSFRKPGVAWSLVKDDSISVGHAITLNGLESYTRYAYRVESTGVPLSEEYAFRTAAGPDQTDFTFVAYGDTRAQHKVHRAVVAQIESISPDFVLHTGDLVGDGSRSGDWAMFFEIEREVMAQAPFFAAIGNHEQNAAQYFDLFHLPGNERWYTITYGNARFVFLQIDGYARFDPDSEQYAWLERTLASNTHPWLFVAFHIPPYSSLREDAIEVSIRETLTPLFERYGVDIVFNGHHHGYQRSIVNGVTYVIAAGGGAPIYEVMSQVDHLVAFRNSHHVVQITVSGNTLTGIGLTPDGEEFDRFRLTAPVE